VNARCIGPGTVKRSQSSDDSGKTETIVNKRTTRVIVAMHREGI
jgi:hypothetical protein